MPQNNIQQTMFQMGAAEDVTASATSIQSTVLSTTFGTGGGAVKAQLIADGDLRYLVGTNPTVTTSTGTRLPDGAGVNIIVPQDQRIAVIAETGTVTLNITNLL